MEYCTAVRTKEQYVQHNILRWILQKQCQAKKSIYCMNTVWLLKFKHCQNLSLVLKIWIVIAFAGVVTRSRDKGTILSTSDIVIFVWCRLHRNVQFLIIHWAIHLWFVYSSVCYTSINFLRKKREQSKNRLI